jgi:glutamine synthetase
VRTFYAMQSEADAYLASALLIRAGYDGIPIKSLRKPQWYVDLKHEGDPPAAADAIVRRVDPDAIGSAKRRE